MPRVFLPDLPSHVTLRGNDRQDIFQSNSDRRRFLADLREEASRNDLRVHAYVLMTNHVHLLSTGAHALSLGRAIQGLGRRYVAYFNTRYERTGTLWEGRYKASPVASDRYLWACHRYIDLNPVRAGAVACPADYVWSSHRFYALGYVDELVSPHACWAALGDSDEARRVAYGRFFDSPLESGELSIIRCASAKGTAIGDEAACRSLELRLGRRVTPGRPGWRPGRPRKGAGDSGNLELE